ncbi:hypothetical protein IU459_33705 [Nocardia amamiensis]|uniref:Secreted protein n=1 Tax=Nocardia amamiensis TaxID=404578 RepID=A0ABS0D0Z5_9NOCA|nr:hypothetical protein [Nocardia amamiensis]MBF6302460.1 hypothetical protein [Nocardia amamiensis]
MDQRKRGRLRRAVLLGALPVGMSVALSGVGTADPGQGSTPVSGYHLTVPAGSTQVLASEPAVASSQATAAEAVPLPAPMPDPMPDIAHSIVGAITSMVEAFAGFLGHFLGWPPLSLGGGR